MRCYRDVMRNDKFMCYMYYRRKVYKTNIHDLD